MQCAFDCAQWKLKRQAYSHNNNAPTKINKPAPAKTAQARPANCVDRKRSPLRFALGLRTVVAQSPCKPGNRAACCVDNALAYRPRTQRLGHGTHHSERTGAGGVVGQI